MVLADTSVGLFFVEDGYLVEARDTLYDPEDFSEGTECEILDALDFNVFKRYCKAHGWVENHYDSIKKYFDYINDDTTQGWQEGI
jgi:hypothetical protein